ncbi:MAG: hypothetical protein ABH827_04360 [bacterium]
MKNLQKILCALFMGLMFIGDLGAMRMRDEENFGTAGKRKREEISEQVVESNDNKRRKIDLAENVLNFNVGDLNITDVEVKRIFGDDQKRMQTKYLVHYPLKKSDFQLYIYMLLKRKSPLLDKTTKDRLNGDNRPDYIKVYQTYTEDTIERMFEDKFGNRENFDCNHDSDGGDVGEDYDIPNRESLSFTSPEVSRSIIDINQSSISQPNLDDNVQQNLSEIIGTDSLGSLDENNPAGSNIRSDVNEEIVQPSSSLVNKVVNLMKVVLAGVNTKIALIDFTPTVRLVYKNFGGCPSLQMEPWKAGITVAGSSLPEYCLIAIFSYLAVKDKSNAPLYKRAITVLCGIAPVCFSLFGRYLFDRFEP